MFYHYVAFVTTLLAYSFNLLISIEGLYPELQSGVIQMQGRHTRLKLLLQKYVVELQVFPPP